MQTLESLRRRIDSTKDMHSVVKTMKALAAVHIREYEAAVASLRDYSRTLRLGFQILFRDRPYWAAERETRKVLPQQELSLAPEEQFLPRPRDTQGGRRFGAIVFGSDQGMCGQFNDEIASYAVDYVKDVTERNADWSLVAVGTRAAGRLEEAGLLVEETVELPTALSGITPLVQELLPHIERWEAERVFVFCNQRVSAASFRSRHFRLLPIDLHRLLRTDEDERTFRTLPTFTMVWDRLFSSLMRQYLFVTIYRACAESLASENASRIASMQAADKDIEERLQEFQSQFNQMRQTSITEELLDVIGGFEALMETEGS